MSKILPKIRHTVLCLSLFSIPVVLTHTFQLKTFSASGRRALSFRCEIENANFIAHNR